MHSKKAAAAKKATSPKKAAAAKRETAKKPKAQKATPRGKLIPLSSIPHPKYGLKFECFACQTLFYLMGRPEATCPKCGVDQRERPKDAPKESPRPKRAAVRPMAPLLDDDDEIARTPDDLGTKRGNEPAEPDAMFDDAEAASAAEDVEVEPTPASAAGDDD